MFRVQEPRSSDGYWSAGRVVQLTLWLALLASLGSSWLVLRLHLHLAAGQDGPAGGGALGPLEHLRERGRYPLAAALLVSAILLVCILLLFWLQRRYLHSQQSLRRVKMHAHDILASMDRGVVTTDLSGSITSINSAASRLLGVDFDCVGLPLETVCSTEGPLREVFRQVAQRPQPLRDHDVSVLRAGRAVRLRLDGDVLCDTDSKAIGSVLHLRDVTERMLMEERMRRLERFIGLASLASGLHHEIKNPLTALSIHVQLLEESLNGSPLGESLAETVGVLRTEVCRLNGVLESFRSFADLQRLSVGPTDALAVVEKAIRLIRPQAREQGVAITLLHPERELPPVPLDAEKFEQVVLNLLINALDAVGRAGELTLSVRVAEEELCVDVTDSGPGIPPEVQRHLFQPYFSTKSHGTGMGLALCEKLVSQHGGTIDYVTGPGGTTFRVRVPLDPTAASP
jgi:PAS domain S-box-containing protein